MEEAWELAAVSEGPDWLQPRRLGGVEFKCLFITEVGERDGYAIEYTELGVPISEARWLEVFRDHETGKCTFKSLGKSIPNEAVEDIIAYSIEEFSKVI
jgi:hypothetical protein